MQRKVLSALTVALFFALAFMPAAMSAESDGATVVPKPYDDGAPKACTFQGIVKYEGDYLPADKLASTQVVIMAAYLEEEDNRFYYTMMPEYGELYSKEYVTANGIVHDFSIDIPKIKTIGHASMFNYYICVENGFKITGVSSQLYETPVSVYPYPYENVPGTDAPWETKRMPVYNAYQIQPSLYMKPNPVFVTGKTADTHNIITLTPAKSTVTGTVTSGKFSLANVNVDFCRLSTPDTVEYSAITDKSGDYYINDVNTGTYVVKVHTNGYSAEDTIFTVSDGEMNTLDVSMTQDSTQYFGYDMPHFLLIIGGVIGIVLIIASLFFQYWVVRKKHDNWVYNDMDDKDE